MDLREYKNPGDIEAEVLMMRQVHAGSFLLVEGVSDVRFWTPRVAEGLCEIVDGNGKPNVVGATLRLDTRHVRGVLGIVDDDWETLAGRPLPSPNLVATDCHDLECLLLRSRALERVLAEHGDRDKIRRFEDRAGASVRSALLDRGIEVGRLRWLAARDTWAYPFGNKGAQRFLEPSRWSLDIDRMHGDVVAAGAYASVEELRAALAALPEADPWLVCNGHDLVATLLVGLRKVLGRMKATVGVDQLSALLRAAFEDAELEYGHLGREIRRWEDGNRHYRILRSVRVVSGRASEGGEGGEVRN